MLGFFSISRSPLGDAGEELFVGQLSPIELYLNLFAVHPDISGDPEGDGVLDPGLGSPPLSQLPLEVFALVVLGVLHQQVLSSQALSGLAQLSPLSGVQLNPDLGEPAPLGACPIELEEAAQLSEGQHHHVQATLVNEAQGVLVGGGLACVGDGHFGHGHGS